LCIVLRVGVASGRLKLYRRRVPRNFRRFGSAAIDRTSYAVRSAVLATATLFVVL